MHSFLDGSEWCRVESFITKEDGIAVWAALSNRLLFRSGHLFYFNNHSRTWYRNAKKHSASVWVRLLLHYYIASLSQVSPLFQFLGIESGSMEVNHLVTNFHFKTLNVNKATFIYLLCVCWCVWGEEGTYVPWHRGGQRGNFLELVLSSICFEVGSLISDAALYAESCLIYRLLGFLLSLMCASTSSFLMLVPEMELRWDRLGSKCLHPQSYFSTPFPHFNTLNGRSVTLFWI